MNAVPGPRSARRRPKLQLVLGSKPTPIRPAAIVLFLGIVLTVLISATLVGDGFKLSSLERQVKQAEEQNLMLRAQVAELGSPSRLDELAQTQGLVVDDRPIGLNPKDLIAQADVKADADMKAVKR